MTEVEESSEIEDELSDTVSAAYNSRLFMCPVEGCVKRFMWHSSLVKQLDCGEHRLALEHETLNDKALKEYATYLDCAGSKSSITTSATLTMGWALKSTLPHRVKFIDKQKQYLNAKFRT